MNRKNGRVVRRNYEAAALCAPLQILERFREPMLRMADIPGAARLMEQRMLLPEDPYLIDLHHLLEQEQLRKAVMSGSAFHGAPPPLGVLPPFVPGRVPIAFLPTGEVLSIPLNNLTKNILICGPTGGGKTNYLRILLLSILHASCNSLVVAFDRKGAHELVDCHSFAEPHLPLLPLLHTDLKLALLQPFPGLSVSIFYNVMVELLSSVFRLQASRRLMRDTLEILCKRQRPPGQWAVLSEWIGLLDALKVSSVSRLGQYKEALMYSLKMLNSELGDVLNFSSSNFLERLFAFQGVVVIDVSGLGVESSSLLAGLLMAHAFYARQGADSSTLSPILFVLDDALPLIHGSHVAESEGGPNLISTFAFLGRSRRLGLVISAQNFSLISPALKNNCDTCLIFGSYGRDAEELARYLNLNQEQAAMLPVIRPGEVIAIARSTWPQAVHGFVPEVV